MLPARANGARESPEDVAPLPWKPRSLRTSSQRAVVSVDTTCRTAFQAADLREKAKGMTVSGQTAGNKETPALGVMLGTGAKLAIAA